MSRPTPRPLALALGLTALASGRMLAQSTVSAPSAAARISLGQTSAYPVQVTYLRDQLQIIANNASLNVILAEVTRSTGMRITGTAREEHVFGTYGPGAPAKVLAELLVGTDTNMSLTETASGTPVQLILTPQNGPASPLSAQRTSAEPPYPATISTQPQTIRRSAVPALSAGSSPAANTDSQLSHPPLTPAERALLMDRLQQQQRLIARP